MTVGASRAELTITRQPALAPSPQPRPAPTAQALPLKHAVPRGQNWTPIGGQIWKPIDSNGCVVAMISIANAVAVRQPHKMIRIRQLDHWDWINHISCDEA